MSKKTITYPCPQCQQPVEWRSDNPARPFCSERCRLIDLGAWANEEYQVPASNSGGDGELEDLLEQQPDDWQPPLH